MDYENYLSGNLIKQFCLRNHIAKLFFFGSITQNDFGPASDIDVLVEFNEGHTPGFNFFLMEAELCRVLGRKVNLHTLPFINPDIRTSVMSEAVPVYEQA